MRIAIASLLLAIALRLAAGAGTMPAAAQTFAEFGLPIPTSRPSAITTGPDGALWFTEAGSKIGRITVREGLTELPIKGGGILHSITTGPDGALWFTEFTSNKIGRIPTTATAENLQLVEFTVPGPLGITTGPDGALWFTERVAGKIGRITTTGTVTEFAAPTAKGGEITTGPDGALWFTGIRGKIGRVTTAGAATEFTIPPEDSSPGGITTGPDGAVWLTEPVSGKIVRMTADGRITEFGLPDHDAQHRVFGSWALVAALRGVLTGLLGWPAGIGDMLTGLFAVPAAIAVATGTAQGRWAAIVWNIFGLADFVVAITMGAITSPGPFQLIVPDVPSIGATGAYPDVLSPAFVVPSSILLHALSLRQLYRRVASLS